MSQALSNILSVLMPVTLVRIDPVCDLYQDMVLGQEYFVFNREYPANYPPNTSCRWSARSPPGTVIVASCDEIRLPSSTNCQQDRLSVSLTGDSTFADARNYCGIGSITLLSQMNAIAIGLFASGSTIGGRFVCTLTAIQNGPPPTTTPPPTVCDCGWKYQTRIVGGTETGVNEFPAMAALIDILNRVPFCGATIISDSYAVTGAHCIYNRVQAEVALLVGDHNVTSGSDTDASALYAIQRFIVHQNYNDRTGADDIAIVRTQLKMKFGLKVGPICLPFRYSTYDFNDQIVTALGWGLQEFSGPRSDVLMKVDLQIISNAQCRTRVPDAISAKQMCSYAEGKDTCQADSGGPLLWLDSSIRRLQLVSVVSKGFGCASFLPAINTRVTAYLTWIIAQTTDAVYCIK